MKLQRVGTTARAFLFTVSAIKRMSLHNLAITFAFLTAAIIQNEVFPNCNVKILDNVPQYVFYISDCCQSSFGKRNIVDTIV